MFGKKSSFPLMTHKANNILGASLKHREPAVLGCHLTPQKWETGGRADNLDQASLCSHQDRVRYTLSRWVQYTWRDADRTREKTELWVGLSVTYFQ